MVNGIAAWAAYALPRGAYGKMLAYAHAEEENMRKLRAAGKNGYSAGFNCMTYALAVLDKGMGYDRPPGEPKSIDHPNAHIARYLREAHESGFFDHRMHEGMEEAVSKRRPKTKIRGIRQRARVEWRFSNSGIGSRTGSKTW